jgi:hypothetical protein
VSQAAQRSRARRTCSLVIAVIFLGQLSGCTSDSATTESADAQVDRTAGSTGARNRVRDAAATIDQPSEPSPEEPVTAKMVIRPEHLDFGEAAELRVYVRIAGAHYLHAAKNPGEPWVPLAVNASLPDGVEFLGDWQLPPPEKGHGDALVYRNSILLRRTLRVRLKTPPRVFRVSGEFRYQVCNDEVCWPPRTIELFAPLSNRDQGK